MFNCLFSFFSFVLLYNFSLRNILLVYFVFGCFWYRQWAILKNLYWTYISSGYMIHDKHIEMAFTIIIYNLFLKMPICIQNYCAQYRSQRNSRDEIDPCGYFLLFNHFMNWKCYQIKYSAFTIWFWTLINHDFLKVCKNVLPMLQF